MRPSGGRGAEAGEDQGGQGQEGRQDRTGHEPKAKAASANKPTPRAGTKQALMIELLKRPEGATVEQIAAATGWQHHTIRGRHLRRAQEEARPHRRGHPHPRGRPQQDRRQGQRTTYRIVGYATDHP